MEYYHRKYIRYNNFDYSSAGLYFITIVVKGRRNLFGNITNGCMSLNDAGRMIESTWNLLVDRFSDIDILDKVVMPNHVHFIVTHTEEKTSVIEVVRQFKAITSRQYHLGVNEKGWIAPEDHLWQRNFYDRIIRSDREYDFVRNYIYHNPERWNKDKLNVDCNEDCDNINMIIRNIQMYKDYNPEHIFDNHY